ncbi:hypothetical protein [Pseudozobellia sp. WGM2]|uniref:hypothetical protein n=1 Tax=Pseudozobellia sp. WGM2 TaxID=2787625 RepID=UPI001ADF20F4|nr:hypothetical protein [Pseudozobellia sp. WGM2]
MTRLKVYLSICCFLFIFLRPDDSVAQEENISLIGKVQSLAEDVSNVLVVNLNSQKSTITDSLGFFKIEVKLNDLIQFSSVQYLKKEIKITEPVFLKKIVTVDLIENVISLNEVTVTPYNLSGKVENDLNRLDIGPIVTSSTLGLPNADLKIMSQSERLLLEADRDKYFRFSTVEEKIKEKNILGYLTVGFTINMGKTINRLSGRTETFEGMVSRDKKMELQNVILSKFSKLTIAENLNIPEINIDGFLTYCLAQSDFLKLSNEEDIEAIWAYLKAKSIEFNETD